MSMYVAEAANRIQEVINAYQDQETYPKYSKFASAEHLARIVAYDNYKPDEEIPILEHDGKLEEYTITKLQTKNLGIVGHILTNNSSKQVHVVFSGLHNFAGMLRSLETGAAGHDSFGAEKRSIADQIAKKISEQAAKVGDKIDLTISGHSLGGADAQNCAATVMDCMVDAHRHSRVNSPSNNAWLQVNSLTVNHLNSVGIKHSTGAKAKKNAEKLSKHGIKINVRALKVECDGIQQTGQTSILADIDPKIANVEMLKISKAPETFVEFVAMFLALAQLPELVTGLICMLYDAYSAHNTLHFAKEFDPTKFDFLDNASNRPQVLKELTDKHAFDNHPIADRCKIGLHFMLKKVVPTSWHEGTTPATLATIDANATLGLKVEVAFGSEKVSSTPILAM